MTVATPATVSLSPLGAKTNQLRNWGLRALTLRCILNALCVVLQRCGINAVVELACPKKGANKGGTGLQEGEKRMHFIASILK